MGTERRTVQRALRLRLLALAVGSLVAGSCDPLAPPFFDIVSVPGTGDILGDVTLDGAARAGAVVVLTRDGTTVETFVSDADGRYEFLNLEPDDYTVSTAIEGATCTESDVSVLADQETEADLSCATLSSGIVQGQVIVNGVGEAGIQVALRQGVTTLATTTTDLQGRYQFAGASPGPRSVQITPPTGVSCDATSRSVSVTAGGTAIADFACTRSGADFTVSMSTPPPGWFHDQPGVSLLECKVIRTSPAQPGATFSATTSGPAEGGPSGVVTPLPVTGVLDANGEAALQVRVNRLGTYVNIVTVTSGAFQRTASATVTVTSDANTCPVVSSSIRFKRDVVELLPADVRPLGLRPVAFRYVEPWGDPSVARVGLIAEEVAEVFPEAVVLDGEGRPRAIDYRILTAAVVREAVGTAGDATKASIARHTVAF